MKRDNPAKHFLIPFLLAVAIYVVAYVSIEHRRNRSGPWEVTFLNSVSNMPALLISQPSLGLTNVQILFFGQPPLTNGPIHLSFRQPKPVPFDLPFGKCIFMDTTFLPGSITFQMFDHQIELLPRVLIIDREEHPWESVAFIMLGPVIRVTNFTAHGTPP